MSTNTASGGVATTAVSYRYAYPEGAVIAGSGGSAAHLSASGGPLVSLQIQSQAIEGSGQSGSPTITSRADASLSDILTETSGPASGYFLVTFSLSGRVDSNFNGSLFNGNSLENELTVNVSDYSSIIPLNSNESASSSTDLSFSSTTRIAFSQGRPSYLDLSLSGALACQSVSGETGPGSCNETLTPTTLSITGFQVFDALGNLSPATVDSSSGFEYQSLSSAPEPRFTFLLGVLPGLLLFVVRKQVHGETKLRLHRFLF